MTLGQKVRTARLERGMTQKELVGDAITRNMLSKIENDAAAPSVKTLEYLAKALDLPVGVFLETENPGSVPDGLDEARGAYREGRWTDCLRALEQDPDAAATDEGFLLRALAGEQAAGEALAREDWAEARDLAEEARWSNEQGMYGSVEVGARLALVLSRAWQALGGRGDARGALERALKELETKE